jgi:hypothetical protein
MAAPKSPKRIVDSLTPADFPALLNRLLDVAEKNPDALPAAHATTEGNPINIRPIVPEASDWAASMQAGAAAAGEKWKAGVLNPRRNPKEEALKANASYKNGVQAALAEDRYAKGVATINLDEMAETVTALGGGVFTAGVAARKGKIERKIGQMRPLVVAAVNAVHALPKDTRDQRRARVLANMDAFESVGKKLRGA